MLIFFAWFNASHFDETEIQMILGWLVVVGFGEIIVKYRELFLELIGGVVGKITSIFLQK